MAPVYMNPPHSSFALAQEQNNEQHLQLLLSSSSHPPPPPLSCPTFFSATQDQRMAIIEDWQQHDQKVNQCMGEGGLTDVDAISSSSLQPMMDMSLYIREATKGNKTAENGSAAKWMPSKMRLMQKMMNSNCTRTEESAKITQKLQYQMDETNEANSFINSNNTVRVCADCNTTTTPLWRSGPRGPKSLCNACGIRQRKARRAAMEAAANGTIAAATDCKMKLQSKEKKSRTAYIAQYKKQCNKSPDPPPHHQSQRKLCFKDFALSLNKNSGLKQVFPPDVEEAAILLMELSCGFIQS